MRQGEAEAFQREEIAISNIVVVSGSSGVFDASGDFTFGQMKNDVCAYYGLDQDPPKVELAGRAIRGIIDELNMRQVWIFNLVESANIPTVAGVKTIALPSDFWKTYNARKTDAIDYTLSPLRREEFDISFQAQTGISGYPYMFIVQNTFRDGTVELFPTPDAVYQIKIRYFKHVAKPSGDSDLLDMPRAYQVVPYYGALSRFGALNDRLDLANYWQGLYDKAYGDMQRDDENMGDEHLRFQNIEESKSRFWDFVSPNARPRMYDFF